MTPSVDVAGRPPQVLTQTFDFVVTLTLTHDLENLISSSLDSNTPKLKLGEIPSIDL